MCEKNLSQVHRPDKYIDKDTLGPDSFSIMNIDKMDLFTIIGSLEKEKNRLSQIISTYRFTSQMDHAIGRKLNRDSLDRINKLLMILKSDLNQIF